MPQITLDVPAEHFPAPRDPSVFARTPAAVVRWGWRARIQAAPLWLAAAVFVLGYTYPEVTAVALGVAGGAAWRAARHPNTAGRMFLSVRERETAAYWMWAGTLWALTEAIHPLQARWSIALLAALTAWPASRWMTSRRTRTTLDRGSRALVARWDPVIGAWGPKDLRGSRVVKGTAKTPGVGAVSFRVKLGPAVHGTSATSEENRRGAEAALGLPVGTVSLATVREDSTLLQVTISPSRHMEGEAGIPWRGPILEPSGLMPIATTQSGTVVGPRSRDKDGVKHMWINGQSGNGKSTTTAVTLLPPVLAGEEILFYLDGGKGTSLEPELAPIMTLTAFDEQSWRVVIRMWNAIMLDRQASRAGITRWRNTAEPYPAIRLVIDETSEVARCVGQAEHDMVAKGGEAGRKVGMPTTQISQGCNADQLVGGTSWRANASQIIAHRPGSTQNAGKALDSVPAAAGIDLMRLPPEPGWVALVDSGTVHFPARIGYASPEEIGALTSDFRPGQLTGRDLEVAEPFLAILRGYVDDDQAEEDAAEAASSRDRLMAVVAAHGELTLGYLTPTDGTAPHAECDTDGCPGWVLKRRQTSDHLSALAVEGRATKEGHTWHAV